MSCSNEIKSVATSYIFIFIPFVALIMVKGFTDQWEELLMVSDWSIASAMIYSSSIITVRNATRQYKGKINDVGLDFFMAVTLGMALISMIIYVFALLQPSPITGGLQIALFLFASRSYFKYGRLAYRLQNKQ